MEIIESFPMEIRHKNKLGYYPLHTACLRGHDTAAMKLIELYPEAAQHITSDCWPLYPLQLAILYRYMSEIVLLKLIEISPKAAIESTKPGFSALHLACNSRSQCETVIEKLIKIYPVAIQENYPVFLDYPIHRAINRNKSITVIKLLLDGDPLGMQRRSERKNETPFHCAFINYNHDLVEYFMQCSDLRINVRDGDGRTLLHYACIYASYDNAEMILNCPDVDVNATDCCNDTPLHRALKNVYPGNPEKCLHMVQKFLDHPYILINYKNNKNKTPIDLIKEHRDELEEKRNRNDHLSPREEEWLQCFINIIHLLEEFTVKKRWKAYCYHAKNFMELL